MNDSKTDWGIYTYYFNDNKCDYLKSANLDEG